MTAAHERQQTLRFIERWPDHEPREHDPGYGLFRIARARLKRLGLLVCQVRSAVHGGPVELHHSKIEFAHINDVDLAKFNDLYGLHLSDDEFRRFVEEEGNLEPLCREHHRGALGVHSLPEPLWLALRVARDDRNIVLPARVAKPTV